MHGSVFPDGVDGRWQGGRTGWRREKRSSDGFLRGCNERKSVWIRHCARFIRSSSICLLVAGKTGLLIQMPHGKASPADGQITTIRLCIDKDAVKDWGIYNANQAGHGNGRAGGSRQTGHPCTPA